MVFFFIAYLIIIALFCLPIDVKFKSFAASYDSGAVITLFNIIDIFPLRKKKNKSVGKNSEKDKANQNEETKSTDGQKIKSEQNKKDRKSIIRFVPDSALLEIFTVDRMLIIMDNFEPLNGYLYVIFNQLANYLRIKDCLYDYQITNVNTSIKKPNIQIYIHLKIRLIMIFSVFLKIIRIRRKK